MPHFTYTARSRAGEKTSGSLKARSKAEAIKEIERMGSFPVTIDQVKEPGADADSTDGGAQKRPLDMKMSISPVANFIAILICAALVWAIVSMFQRSDSTVDQALVEIAKKHNATLPVQIDSETRLDRIMAEPGKRLTYFYTLFNVPRRDTDAAKFISTMKPLLINDYRTSPQMAGLRKEQVELHYCYRDRNGNIFAEFVVSPKDF